MRFLRKAESGTEMGLSFWALRRGPGFESVRPSAHVPAQRASGENLKPWNPTRLQRHNLIQSICNIRV